MVQQPILVSPLHLHYSIVQYSTIQSIVQYSTVTVQYSPLHLQLLVHLLQLVLGGLGPSHALLEDQALKNEII